MPNVKNMEERMQSHLARVSEKALKREIDRINALRRQERVSEATARHMVSSAPIRLAYRANAA